MKIAQHILTPITDWATANYRTFKPNGMGRYYTSDLTAAPSEVWEIKDLLMWFYGIPAGTPQEPVFKDFCGVNEEGAAVHAHIDTPANHTRLNVMVQKPEGGDPVLDGSIITLEQGETWRCNAGRCTHGSTPTEGKLRIVLSFGFLP